MFHGGQRRDNPNLHNPSKLQCAVECIALSSTTTAEMKTPRFCPTKMEVIQGSYMWVGVTLLRICNATSCFHNEPYQQPGPAEEFQIWLGQRIKIWENFEKKVCSEHFSKTFFKVLESAKISLDKSQLIPYVPPGLKTQEILLWIWLNNSLHLNQQLTYF